MLYISRIKMRSFKSFKYVDITIPSTFLCLAGPNGSGKSNICDAIRFVLGEISLKSLRAKKVKDLIFAGATAAEVAIYLDGDEKIEIKRAIREDGKILYKLNGKKTTRTSILESLKKYNLDDSGRNIIAQGEVQRIINMNGKERRQIIDSVAGISDFEDKKNEAMKELGIVDAKVGEGNLLLGEKMAFLSELDREKTAAIEYTDAKKTLYNAKASLLKSEIERFQIELNEVKEKDLKLVNLVKEKENEIAGIESQIAECDKDRMIISKELQEKQQTSSLIREIEAYKSSISSKSQVISDKKEELKRLEIELNQLKKQLEHSNSKSVIGEIQELKKSLKQKEEEFGKLKKADSFTKVHAIESELNTLQNQSQQLRGEIITIETEIKSKNELLEAKTKEFKEMDSSVEAEEDKTHISDEIESLRKDLKSTADLIDNSFKEEKELNTESADLDRKLLELREQHSVLRMQVSPSSANPALRAILELRTTNSISGIYGTVAELIKFETKYTSAVESGAGSRLSYVVVDSSDIASKIIKHLKKTGSGRATFIPLREIKTGQFKNPTGNPLLTSLLTYSNGVSKAMDYVFGETVLVQDMDEAKKLGIGNLRMVTFEGEIFEKSGIISGGKLGSSILASTQLAKLDAEINSIKDRKNEIIRELTSTREDASRKRSYKSEIELKIKTLELELRSGENKGKAEELLRNKKDSLSIETEALTTELKKKLKDTALFKSNMQKLDARIDEAKEKLIKEEEKIKQESDSENRFLTDLSSSISSLRATIDGKNKELELLTTDETRTAELITQKSSDLKEVITKINESKNQINKESEELKKSEEQISAHSKKVESLFEKLKQFEEQLKNFGEKRGKIRIDLDKYSKEAGVIEVKRATLETRLQDANSEFFNYKEFKFMDLPKEDLHKLVKESEYRLDSIGNVNMMAIEMYDKKKIEIDEIKQKIETLDSEKNAIMQMIAEIDQKKKDAFFETFYAVSDNFRKMFEKISVGEGFIYLDKPNAPFESGLHIKIKRHNREHTLDSLSGGENTIVALMFIFALQFFKPSPFYILDEVDAALDKENSKTLAKLVKQMAEKTQFILVSHNDNVMSNADAVLGVTKVEGSSKIVGVKLETMVVG